MKLEIELDAMSTEQASEAASVLRKALDKVTGIGERGADHGGAAPGRAP